MCALVVLGLVFPYQAKRLALERLQNYLFCVEWDIKPQLNQQKIKRDEERQQSIQSSMMFKKSSINWLKSGKAVMQYYKNISVCVLLNSEEALVRWGAEVEQINQLFIA